MFQIHISTTPHCLSDADLDELSMVTEGYSGSDISVLVRQALMEPIRTIQIATHFKVVSAPDPKDPSKLRHDMLLPCSPGDPQGVEMSLMQIDDPERLLPPPVTRDDFLKALKYARPSVSKDDLVKQEEFTRDFGQDS